MDNVTSFNTVEEKIAKLLETQNFAVVWLNSKGEAYTFTASEEAEKIAFLQKVMNDTMDKYFKEKMELPS